MAHPSNSLSAPILSDYLPAGQLRGKHAIVSMPVDYVPALQVSHPWFDSCAPFLVAYWPGEHAIAAHVVDAAPVE